MDRQVPVRILSLDGGGIRGVSSLYILKEVMAQIERERAEPNLQVPLLPLRPHQVFDLICGTNTGGLIALMLGRLEMVFIRILTRVNADIAQSVEEAIAMYESMAKDVFSSISRKAAFDHVQLETHFKRIIAQSPLKLPADAPLAVENVGCKTFVISVKTRASGIPVLMRSYQTKTAHASGAKIWEAARATSATPTFFEPVLIDGRPYSDGGTGWNNPTVEAIAEACKMWPNRPIGCLLSIGTGLEEAIQLGDGSQPSPNTSFKLEVAKYCVECLTSCEKIHHDVCTKFSDRILVDENYFRLNVPQGISSIGLEEWEKIEDLRDLTEKYMEQGDMERRKQTMANLLLNPQSSGLTLLYTQISMARTH
jgi:hypothetical protein